MADRSGRPTLYTEDIVWEAPANSSAEKESDTCSRRNWRIQLSAIGDDFGAYFTTLVPFDSTAGNRHKIKR